MKSQNEKLSASSLNVLRAISHYRRNRRASRNWIIGDRSVSAATILKLERSELVREIAITGTPTLVLTDAGKSIIAGKYSPT